MAFKLGMAVDLCTGYILSHFDDLDLMQGHRYLIGRETNSALNYLDN